LIQRIKYKSQYDVDDDEVVQDVFEPLDSVSAEGHYVHRSNIPNSNDHDNGMATQSLPMNQKLVQRMPPSPLPNHAQSSSLSLVTRTVNNSSSSFNPQKIGSLAQLPRDSKRSSTDAQPSPRDGKALTITNKKQLKKQLKKQFKREAKKAEKAAILAREEYIEYNKAQDGAFTASTGNASTGNANKDLYSSLEAAKAVFLENTRGREADNEPKGKDGKADSKQNKTEVSHINEEGEKHTENGGKKRKATSIGSGGTHTDEDSEEDSRTSKTPTENPAKKIKQSGTGTNPFGRLSKGQNNHHHELVVPYSLGLMGS